MPFFLTTLAVINADKNKLIAPRTVDILGTKFGEIFEYKTTMQNIANKIANMATAVIVPNIVVLNIFFNLVLSKIKTPSTLTF